MVWVSAESLWEMFIAVLEISIGLELMYYAPAHWLKAIHLNFMETEKFLSRRFSYNKNYLDKLNRRVASIIERRPVQASELLTVLW